MIDFPNSPTVGQTFVAAGTTYQCTQVSPNVWLGTPASGLGIPDAPNDGVQYGRQSKAWTPVASPVGTYVLKTGDTMTGALTVANTVTVNADNTTTYNATLVLNKAADANGANILAKAGGVSRWSMSLGGGGASDFILQGYADNGVSLGGAFSIARTTGQVKIVDGTVAAPGISFASNPSTGWYQPTAGAIHIVTQGGTGFRFDASAAGGTYASINPRLAAGNSSLFLANFPLGGANGNTLGIQANAASYNFNETLSGSATAKPLQMAFPAGVQVNCPLSIGGNNVIQFAGGGRIDLINASFPAITFNSAGTGFVCTASDQGVVWQKQNPTSNIWAMSGTGDMLISGSNATKASGTTWANPSSRSIKHDIRDYTAGLAEILRVQPRTYRLNDMPEVICVGTVADEIEGPFPQSIVYDKDGMPLFQADPVMWALVNAVKTLNAKIEALQ